MHFYFLLIALLAINHCGNHSSLSPSNKGVPGEPLDAVIKRINEKENAEDSFGSETNKTFEVYMTSIPDENGDTQDEGIIQLSPKTL